MYPADGRKIPDVYTNPAELRDELQKELGQFPLFEFWGPMTSIRSTQWIAEAAIRVDRNFDPTLTVIYLPHLDYGLQRWGPNDQRIAAEAADLDRVAGKLVDHFRSRGARILIVSEYGIQPVSRRFISIAYCESMACWRFARSWAANYSIRVRAPHLRWQIIRWAHVYVNDRSRVPKSGFDASVSGVARVLDQQGKSCFIWITRAAAS